MKRILALTALIVAVPAYAIVTPIYFWELAPTHANLSVQPLNNDLVNGFGEAAAPGPLNNKVMNESFYGYADEFGPGIIDPLNEVYSMLMYSGNLCLELQEPGLGQNSDGFLPGYPGSVTKFVDGVLNGPLDGITRDYARIALVVRFGFNQPTDIGGLRVIGGNTLNKDGRTFHHYDVWASTDGLGAFGNFFPVALGVKSGTFGMINANLWSASLTRVSNYDGKVLIDNCTDLRICFYNASNTGTWFVDPYQGIANEDPAHQACEVEPGDVDGVRKAFEASIIREVDVLAPGVDTPWGDIDYDGDSDMVDIAAFQSCFSNGPATNGCFRFDLNESGSFQIADLNAFAALLTGPQ